MKTREKFKRRVIELIHGLPYEEAIEKEKTEELFGHTQWKDNKSGSTFTIWIQPITIGRVMQAIGNSKEFQYIELDLVFTVNEPFTANLFFTEENKEELLKVDWKLTKENGQEADDDFQTDETINKLYNLLK